MKTYVVKGTMTGPVVEGPFPSGEDAIEAMCADPDADLHGYVLINRNFEARNLLTNLSRLLTSAAFD